MSPTKKAHVIRKLNSASSPHDSYSKVPLFFVSSLMSTFLTFNLYLAV